MKIFNYLNYEVEQKNFLYEALEINIEEKNIISFVGGGGKTTSIYTLAKELSKLGKKGCSNNNYSYAYARGFYRF